MLKAGTSELALHLLDISEPLSFQMFSGEAMQQILYVDNIIFTPRLLICKANKHLAQHFWAGFFYELHPLKVLKKKQQMQM